MIETTISNETIDEELERRLLSCADKIIQAFAWVYFTIDKAAYHTIKHNKYTHAVAQFTYIKKFREKYIWNSIESIPIIGSVFYRGFVIFFKKDLSRSRRWIKSFATSTAIITYYCATKLLLWWELTDIEKPLWLFCVTYWTAIHRWERWYDFYRTYSDSKEEELNNTKR